MKKTVLILMSLLLLISAVSCSNKNNGSLPEGMSLLDNEATDYYFYYPSAWSADRNDGVVSAYVSDKDPSNVSVTTFVASNEVNSVDSYLEMGDTTYFDHMKATFPDLEMLTDGEEITLGGVPARRYVFTATVAGDPYKFSQAICYAGGNIYMLTYTSSINTFDSHIDEVNKIITEFKFK